MGSIRQAILIMAKRPQAGKTKTRLCPPLTPEQAAGLSDAFLRDSVANALRADCAEVVLAFAPEEEEDWFAEQFPGRARIPQRGNDLGKRLVSVLDTAWQRRYQPCVVLGADSPDLPPEILREAFEKLRPGAGSADVVLGPATDGGYILIGLRWKEPRLFTDIAWSTPQVLAQTQERAISLGLRVALLPEWPDVDTPEDLQALRERFQNVPQEVCPATRALLPSLSSSRFAGD